MTEQQKEVYRNWYSDGFDAYVADGRTPTDSPVEGDDILGQYMRDVIDRNPNLGGDDPKYRESFKENMQQFVGDMLDKFSNLDRAAESEKMMQQRFQQGSPGEQRAMWKHVKQFAKAKYSPTALNVDGYDEQLNEDNEEQIFDMFAREWQQASDDRRMQTRRNLLSSASADWEKACERSCQKDYRIRNHIAKILLRFPLLEEIAKIIGREHIIDNNEKSSMAERYRPSSLSSTPSFEEIERITTGNNLERVIPSELSYLADRDTEPLFLAKYAQRRLQQFSAPGCTLSTKEPESKPMPRPAAGPIIVSVDTSGSMQGRPMEIAFAMLHQLLDIAKRENRAIYLITFSVRSQSIDLSEPGKWRHIDEFLANSYSGGTNGEQMLRDAINRLYSDNYSMADVLIISDFAFAPPLPETLAAIRREQLNDTRFYGLRIGPIKTPYQNILDNIWTMN